MATINSNSVGGGKASVASSWAGGLVPTNIDDVVILAGDTITLDSTVEYKSLTSYGILSVDRSVATSIKTYGNMLFYAGAVDFGSEADPIMHEFPLTIIIESPGKGTYGFSVYDGVDFSVCGEYKVTQTHITADVAAAGNIVFLDNVTGLVTGDILDFETNQLNGNQAGNTFFSSEILSVDIGAKQVSLSDPVPYAMDGTTHPFFVGVVGNAITFRQSNLPELTVATTSPYLRIVRDSTDSNNKFVFKNVTIRGFSAGSYQKDGGIIIYGKSTGEFAKNNNFGVTIAGVTFWNMICNGPALVYCKAEINDIFCGVDGSLVSAAWTGIKGGTISWGSRAVGSDWLILHMNRDYGLRSDNGICELTDIKMAHCGIGWESRSDSGSVFTNLVARKTTNLVNTMALAGATFVSPTLHHITRILYSSGFGELSLIDPLFINEPSSEYITPTDAYYGGVFLVNKNVDPLQQIKYYTNGSIERDNTVYKNGDSSLKFTPVSSARKLTHSWDIIAVPDELTLVGGHIRLSADYNGSLPIIRLSGLGINPPKFVMPPDYIPETWIPFTLSATQTAGANGVLNLVIDVDGTVGSVWVDSISAPAPVAIDTGAMGVWSGASPSKLISANFVTANDLWQHPHRTLTRGTRDSEIDSIKMQTDDSAGKLDSVLAILASLPGAIWTHTTRALTGFGTLIDDIYRYTR